MFFESIFLGLDDGLQRARIGSRVRCPIGPQSAQVEHRQPAEFEAQQPRAFELVQGCVRALPRDRGEQADLLLAELHEGAGARVEGGVEQARETARDARVRAEQPVEFDQPDEEAQARIQLRQQEAVERQAGRDQPLENMARYAGETGVSDRDAVVAPAAGS